MSWGGVIDSLIKLTFLVPSPLQNIKVFFDLVPPLQKNKITNANTNTEDNSLTTNKKTNKMTSHFFPRELITNLTPC